MQEAFVIVQRNLLSLKLVLNDKKTKCMVFSRKHKCESSPPPLYTLQGNSVELVSSYRYLGFVLEEDLSFKLHVKQLLSKLRLRGCFIFGIVPVFHSRLREVGGSYLLTCLRLWRFFYRNTTKALLQSLDSVYHSALRFITRTNYYTHHCALYEMVGWPSLHLRRYKHWLILVYKTIVGQLPLYMTSLLTVNSQGYNLRSSRYILLNVPLMKTEFGKTAFIYSAPTAWNEIQRSLKLTVFI